MAAPRKVKEKAELANKLIAERANTPQGDPAPPAPQPDLTVVTNDPVVATPPQPGSNPYAIDPMAVPNAPPAAPVTDDWKHKYDVLKGMFDKSRSENTTRVSQLENQVNLLTDMAKPPTTYQDTFHPEVVPPKQSDYGLSEEQIEELGGQDFVDSIGKISAAGAAGEIASLKNEIGTLKQTQSETLDDMFYARLSELSPDWRSINAKDEFNQWLSEGEGLSGIARSNFLTNAYDSRDAETAARYFNQFAALKSPPGPNSDANYDLIPSHGGGGAPPSSGVSGNVYTPQTIRDFFKDKGLGRWKGREKEAAAIEMDIFAAQKEGRIMLARGRQPA